MSTEINEIINSLCERFGTTAEKLIPAMARYYIATNSFGLILGLILMLAGAFLFPKAIKADADSFNDTAWIVGPIALIVIGIIPVLLCGSEIIGWIVSPTGATIQLLIDTIHD